MRSASAPTRSLPALAARVLPTLASALAALVFPLAACSRPEPITVELPRPPSGPRPELFPSAQPVATAAPTATTPAKPTPFPLTRQERDAPKLGTPCTDADRPFCGTGTRVAVTAHHYQFRMNVKRVCEPLRLRPLQLRNGEHHATSACVAGDHLIVDTTCVVCRMPTGTSIEGLVSEMTPGQLAFLQEHMGLPGEPAITAAAWDGVIQAANANAMKSMK